MSVSAIAAIGVDEPPENGRLLRGSELRPRGLARVCMTLIAQFAAVIFQSVLAFVEDPGGYALQHPKPLRDTANYGAALIPLVAISISLLLLASLEEASVVVQQLPSRCEEEMLLARLRQTSWRIRVANLLFASNLAYLIYSWIRRVLIGQRRASAMIAFLPFVAVMLPVLYYIRNMVTALVRRAQISGKSLTFLLAKWKRWTQAALVVQCVIMWYLILLVLRSIPLSLELGYLASNEVNAGTYHRFDSIPPESPCALINETYTRKYCTPRGLLELPFTCFDGGWGEYRSAMTACFAYRAVLPFTIQTYVSHIMHGYMHVSQMRARLHARTATCMLHPTPARLP